MGPGGLAGSDQGGASAGMEAELGRAVGRAVGRAEGAVTMGLHFDPSPGPPFCGYGYRKPPWWEPWAVLAGCAVLVVLGWLMGGR